MSEPLPVRRGGAGDVSACLEIARSLPDYVTPTAVAKMEQDFEHQVTYVAAAPYVVGFLTLRRHNVHTAEVSWLAVQRGWWRQGFGAALVKAAATDLQVSGGVLLQVKTLAATMDYRPYAITRQFYEKCGFFHLETIDPFPGWDPGNPCAIYVKVLGIEDARSYKP